ncbi:MAG: Asp-tRNA(Asn)/Glu-tRNA(Gln) amidotransferase subunit GatA [Geothrix sp.]|uniref:Asp-tRNA(Asn)/Glu-tRNA(Gln) amidotransferase subunit GatA n=1 Tax=Geothrix sp. TaxID=1962974 RepID=UPI0017D6A33F|nr:Asp-tRNA(Asn)/Glu-tRNA(Gln) amidotransferase subunit GatA [Geothrix sp.]NWJ39892.1 Asp-tRNA(Asn)/Glu-tRNA(Gln) amidotransferase subunit GatA [Geothrix sp.]WIL22095.1 MAG: Asp-tRNA(Asn)/Glu-tRNA(Gln) amidotransferase subunit GatA [Geothrix sp.]
MAAGTAVDWREGLDAGDVSSEILVKTAFERIRRLDPLLGAILAVNEERSLQLARAADARLRAGERSPVLGLPIVLKDNLNWRGLPVSCGSRVLDGYMTPYDATVVDRLLQAGAVPVAKANMDEFAMGSSGEYSAFGPARNPWDTTRVPGGSSSGSVVAVAAGYAPLALGSDTGGSVRLPASFCNVTALRPTYGVLSRFGLTAMASSLDQVGPIAATAADLALALGAMVGRDPLDSTSSDLPGAERLASFRPKDLKGLRIGLPREYFGDGLEAGVRSLLEGALRVYADQGAEIREVSLPHTRYAIDTYYLICTSEVSSNLSRFDGVRYGHRAKGGNLREMIAETRDEGLGAEVKRRILLGAFCLSKGYYDAFYLKAMKARTLIARDFEQVFESVDVLATPVSPGVAFPFGVKTEDPMAMYLADAFTVTAPLAGLPCLSMPAGFTAGLPAGIQLIGPAFSDVMLLETAHAFQLLTTHHLEIPPPLSA